MAQGPERLLAPSHVPPGPVNALHKLALAASFAVMALPALALAFLTMESLVRPLGGYSVA